MYQLRYAINAHDGGGWVDLGEESCHEARATAHVEDSGGGPRHGWEETLAGHDVDVESGYRLAVPDGEGRGGREVIRGREVGPVGAHEAIENRLCSENSLGAKGVEDIDVRASMHS